MRRLVALLNGLPPDSAYRRDGKAWTQEHELAALLIERQEMWLSTLVGMWAAKGSRLPDAIRVQHPDRPDSEPTKKRPVSDAAEIRRRMAAMAGRG